MKDRKIYAYNDFDGNFQNNFLWKYNIFLLNFYVKFYLQLKNMKI